MDFTLFHSRFPEIAETETRVITILRHDGLPADGYALLESYCEQRECDYRAKQKSPPYRDGLSLLSIFRTLSESDGSRAHACIELVFIPFCHQRLRHQLYICRRSLS